MACGVPDDMYTRSLMVFNFNGLMTVYSCFKHGKNLHHLAGGDPWNFHLKGCSTADVVEFPVTLSCIFTRQRVHQGCSVTWTNFCPRFITKKTSNDALEIAVTIPAPTIEFPKTPVSIVERLSHAVLHQRRWWLD